MIDPDSKTPFFPKSEADQILDLDHHRNLTFYYFSFIIALVLTPFVLVNYLQGHLIVTVIIVILILISAANVVSMRKTMIPVIKPIYAVLPLIFGVPVAIAKVGAVVAFWAYPGVVVINLIFKPAIANRFNLLFLIVVTFTSFMVLDISYAVRILVTMALTIIFSRIFSNVVETQHQELSKLIITDPLTGAFNRHSMEKTMSDAIERRKRHSVKTSVIALDIDHFKSINDELGHLAGDKALIEIVKLIQSRLRSPDSLFRSGGEEFIILAPDTGIEDALLLADDIRTLIAEAAIVRNRRITISGGVGEVRSHDDSDSLIYRVDCALYEAKKLGRNRMIKAESDG